MVLTPPKAEGTAPTHGGAAMPQYIGIDLHKATAFITRMDQRGRILEQVNLRTDAPTLQGYLRRLRPDVLPIVVATPHQPGRPSTST